MEIEKRKSQNEAVSFSLCLDIYAGGARGVNFSLSPSLGKILVLVSQNIR